MLLPKNLHNNSNFIHLVTALIALLLVVGIYAPGLSGAFMLDDFGVLPPLYETIETCGQFCGIMSGSTGPTGRPLSLLSFALQDSSWPNAYNFKLVNLIIHAFNAVLIYLIFCRILPLLGFLNYVQWLALAAAFLWAIWPLQLSSVLYVVQRMTLLSSFFVLLAIFFYLVYRPCFTSSDWGLKSWKFHAFYLVLGVIGVFSLISKESGVLLLVYLAVLEYSLFNKQKLKTLNIIVFRYLCIIVPLVLFWSLVIYKLVSEDKHSTFRDFTILERLLTEGRVIVDYLKLLVFPDISKLGLYHDNYLKSDSLISPISTLYSWLFIVGAFLVAFIFRHKLPLLFIAVAWFLGGHSLESTVWPLELYFEHRNYLPVAMIALAMTALAFHIIRVSSKRYVAIVFGFVFGGYILVMSLATFGQSKLWGDELQYGVVSAHENPESVRARTLVIDIYNKLGFVDIAYKQLGYMKIDFPNVAGIILGDIEFACFSDRYQLDPIEDVVNGLNSAKFGYSALVSIKSALEEKAEDKCEAVSYDYLMRVVEALLQNPVYKRKENMLMDFKAAIHMRRGEVKVAADIYDSMKLVPEQWTIYITVLATSGQLEKAYKACLEAEEKLSSKPQYHTYLTEVRRLRAVLAQDLGLSE